MLTFNLIEGHGPDYDYEQVQEDYQNMNYTVQEIREKHNITKSQWQGVIRRFKDDNIQLRKTLIEKQTIKAKFYSYDKRRGLYRIQKQINGKRVFYCYCKTEKEAQDTVEYLKQHNWNKSCIKKR